MRKRKLKRFVLPTLYLLITISIFAGVILLGSDFELTNKDYNYSVDTFNEDVETVISEDNTSSSIITSPIEDNTAEISVHFYSSKDSEAIQEQSLIYYENTYLPNTGILYTSDEEFNVLAVFNGKVIEIKEDEFFGKCLVLEHTNNLKTYYYGLDDIEVAIGDEITSGGVLGVSKNNQIMNNKKSFLFEVYYNNELVNPETFINKKITDYN